MATRPRHRLTLSLDLWRAERAGAAGCARRRERRLADLVAHARAASPFFAAHYRGLPEAVALSALPPTTKSPLMGAFDAWATDRQVTRAAVERFVADPSRIGTPFLGRYLVWTSSGTSGHPGLFLQDAGARALYRSLSTRVDRAWLDARTWRALVRRRFRWVSVLATGGHFAGESWTEFERRRSAWKRHSDRVVPVQQSTAALVAQLNEADPAILTLYPSTALQLAEEQRAGRLRLRPALVELSGESVSPDERAALEAAFGAPVHQVYACSESLLLAFDCREGWLHVNEDWVVLEPVDEASRPTAPGVPSHTVLLTNLANRVQPILRYDLGDSVVTKPEPCGCGSPLQAIRVMGRHDDVLLFGEGAEVVRVPPIALTAFLSRQPAVARGQFVQVGPRALELRLEPRPGTTAVEAWRALEPGLTSLLRQLGVVGGTVALSTDAPRVDARSGKLRQVLAWSAGGSEGGR